MGLLAISFAGREFFGWLAYGFPLVFSGMSHLSHYVNPAIVLFMAGIAFFALSTVRHHLAFWPALLAVSGCLVTYFLMPAERRSSSVAFGFALQSGLIWLFAGVVAAVVTHYAQHYVSLGARRRV